VEVWYVFLFTWIYLFEYLVVWRMNEWMNEWVFKDNRSWSISNSRMIVCLKKWNVTYAMMTLMNCWHCTNLCWLCEGYQLLEIVFYFRIDFFFHLKFIVTGFESIWYRLIGTIWLDAYVTVLIDYWHINIHCMLESLNKWN